MLRSLFTGATKMIIKPLPESTATNPKQSPNYPTQPSQMTEPSTVEHHSSTDPQVEDLGLAGAHPAGHGSDDKPFPISSSTSQHKENVAQQGRRSGETTGLKSKSTGDIIRQTATANTNLSHKASQCPSSTAGNSDGTSSTRKRKRHGAAKDPDERASDTAKREAKSTWATKEAQRPKSWHFLKTQYRFLLDDNPDVSLLNFEAIPVPPKCAPPPTELLTASIGMVSDVVATRQPAKNATKAPPKFTHARVELPFKWFDASRDGEQGRTDDDFDYRVSTNMGNIIAMGNVVKDRNVKNCQYKSKTYLSERQMYIAMLRDAARMFYSVWYPTVAEFRGPYFEYVRQRRLWETDLLRQAICLGGFTFPDRSDDDIPSHNITVFDACEETVKLDEYVEDNIGSHFARLWEREIIYEPWFAS